MIVNVFAVFDAKVGSFAQPWFSPNVASATRAFQEACRDPGSMLNKHPADFHLYLLGSFDDENGKLTSQEPANLGTAASFIVAKE